MNAFFKESKKIGFKKLGKVNKFKRRYPYGSIVVWGNGYICPLGGIKLEPTVWLLNLVDVCVGLAPVNCVPLLIGVIMLPAKTI